VSRRIVVFDTETGGFDANTNAVLSVGMVLWKDGEIAGETEVKVRDPGVCSPDALRVNNINMAEHWTVALEPTAACDAINAWLSSMGYGIGEKVELCAHNMAFDVPFLKRLWESLAHRVYRNRFGYTMRCTMTLATMLKEAGALPVRDVRNATLMSHFGIPPDGALHSALVDARGTARVYTKLDALLSRLIHPTIATDGHDDDPR
jgi:DNA polymerase III epsilon subunit-like protein